MRETLGREAVDVVAVAGCVSVWAGGGAIVADEAAEGRPPDCESRRTAGDVTVAAALELAGGGVAGLRINTKRAMVMDAATKTTAAATTATCPPRLRLSRARVSCARALSIVARNDNEVRLPSGS